MQALNEFKEKFKLARLTLFTTKHWTVSIRPVQVTVGSMVLSLSRECVSLADMTPHEGADLPVAIKKLERLLSATFNPDRINYLALMMVDPQVHFHVIPRYEKPIDFAGEFFTDTNWPKPADVLSSIELDPHQVWSTMHGSVER